MRASMSVRIMGAILALGLVLGPVASVSAQPKAPADYEIAKGEKSPGKVTFSHEKHKAFAEKCSSCHTKIFKMKKGQTGPFTMAKMDAGEMCGACHNGKTDTGGKVAFATNDKASCEKCHKK